MAGHKNRKNPRAHVALVARYRSPTAFEFVEEECVDLSSGGMFIKSKAPAPAGTLLKLECDVDHGKSTMRAVARVVWLRDRDSSDEPRGMGVKFVKLEPGGRELIAQVLERVGGDEGAGPQARSSIPPAPEPTKPVATPSAISLAPALIQQARIEPTAELPTKLIEAKPPSAVPSDPAPPAKSAARPEPAKQAAATAAKPGPAAPAKSEPRRSSAAPRSDVPTHRPPASRGLDMRAIGIGAVLLIGVVIAVVARREPAPAATPPVETVSAEPVAQPPSAPAAPANQSFELRLTTLPAGARVTVAGKTGTSPLSLELGTLTSAVDVRVEKEGFEPVTSSVELERFVDEDGKRVATVMLALPALPREAAAAPTNVSTAAQVAEPAAAAAKPAKPEPSDAPAEKSRAARSIAAKRATPKPESAKPAATEAAAPSAPSEPAASPAPAPEPPPVAATPAPAPAAPAPAAVAATEPAPKPAAMPMPAAPSGALTPMQAARACLARSDKACAVAALEGRTRTAQELELLVETYRSMGNGDAVNRYMKLYVERFPSERRAAAYSTQLGAPAPQ